MPVLHIAYFARLDKKEAESFSLSVCPSMPVLHVAYFARLDKKEAESFSLVSPVFAGYAQVRFVVSELGRT
jgi:hypothetical protein